MPTRAIVTLLLASTLLAGCTIPWRSNEATAGPAALPACLYVGATVVPDPVTPGTPTTLSVNVTNNCKSAIQVAQVGCGKNGLDVAVLQGTQVWRYQSPHVSADRSCPAAQGSASFAPGASLSAAWTWDGQLAGKEGTRAAPPGAYVARFTLGDGLLAEVPFRVA
ncbi:MAG: hypothetical protein QOE90_13 [Thermoplasmata archaeon]|jgi:hypothetical protein|nr:hypothetical protein [Thermoplasmata archaeon]